MKIENSLVPLAYEVSKKVYHGELKLKEGKESIVENKRMNPNSAADYINNFKYLVQGKKFTRTLNFFSMEYFLDNIYKDFGRIGLANSLLALRQHIDYYEGKQKSKMHKMRQLLQFYSLHTNNFQTSIQQEQILNELILSNATKEEIIADLKSYEPPKKGSSILTKIEIRKRDNLIVAKLKIAKDFKCQICGKQIEKSDGSYYIEAAHIKAKKEEGNEAPNNILILCPNHHKEFDYGKLVIEKHTKKKVVFNLNGVKHEISLLLK